MIRFLPVPAGIRCAAVLTLGLYAGAAQATTTATPTPTPAPPNQSRYPPAIAVATPAASGPPNRPAMLSTTERASNMTPGANTTGVIMPMTQIPPKRTPEDMAAATLRPSQKRLLILSSRLSANSRATPLMSSMTKSDLSGFEYSRIMYRNSRNPKQGMAAELAAYFNCTEPETVTTTAVLPASTGNGASTIAALASNCINLGRGAMP